VRIVPELDFTSAPGNSSIHPLRNGSGPWQLHRPQKMPLLRVSGTVHCDVVVVGAGITGAMTAEILTRAGHSVIVVDRAFPGRGSTAASTAMLLWEIDTPLVELADLYGFEKASAVYQRSLLAVSGIADMVEQLALPCQFALRPSLYLAPTGESDADLAQEHTARARAGLPGALLSREELIGAFGFDRPAALVSPGSAEADPALLSHGLLQAAFRGGARLVADEAVRYDWDDESAYVALASGASLHAKKIVLATGYDMPDFVRSDLHSIVSTWCVSTGPVPRNAIWNDRALLWEADDPYLYARLTQSDEIVLGGEDEVIEDADERDKKMAEKSAALARRMRDLWPDRDYTFTSSWTAAFGQTEDGLPLIGPVPGARNILAAYGYGGNGITFSFMASRIIAELVAGAPRPWFDDFALDRGQP
jgi:glycine/D-amino acid oxidase-like deaminating enzyme